MRSILSRLHARRARALSSARSQRGMTLLEIMIVLAILALIMGLVVGPRVMKLFSKSKEDVAAATVKRLAFQDYPEWTLANSDKPCPANVEALGMKENKDPWGQPYRMLCGANLPAGATGIAIVSNGPDQKENTPDDIKSW